MPPLTLDKLESPPRPSDAHMWADYIELLCMVNRDRSIYDTDLLDRAQERSDLGEITASTEFGQVPDDESPAVYSDRQRQKVADWFRHLQYRSGAFSDSYPFALTAGGFGLKLRGALSLKQKLYIFLLLAANLRYVESEAMQRITSAFEVASLLALKRYVPSSSRAFLFGANYLNKGRYSGKVFGRIDRLAKDLRETNRCRPDDPALQGNGDAGLDLVAWVPTGDDGPGFLLVFGQCACSKKDWVIKQHSSSRDAWSSKLTFTSPPSNMVFIPLCFRSPTGEWYSPSEVQNSILVDRLRIVYLLGQTHVALRKLIEATVDSALLQTESLF